MLLSEPVRKTRITRNDLIVDLTIILIERLSVGVMANRRCVGLDEKPEERKSRQDELLNRGRTRTAGG